MTKIGMTERVSSAFWPYNYYRYGRILTYEYNL